MVNANLINDDEAVLVAKEIADDIKANVQYPGEIKVSVISCLLYTSDAADE